MYSTWTQAERLAQLGELGFSLKPPDWLRKAVAGIAQSTTITVDPGAGIPVSVNLGDKDAIARLRKSVKANVSIGQPTPSILDTAVQAVPGGGMTLMLGAVALLAVLMLSRRR